MRGETTERRTKRALLELSEESLWIVFHLVRRRLSISPAKSHEVLLLELSRAWKPFDSLRAQATSRCK
ncbi:reverse transcriptase [Gossypium australe]|uniref:Reverse transcriptase n=1 Tax=Gossypium australe TaxID=47621 RepID=A0A5B6UV01_9ROSI|nr:reverse transcriptase [Gossypium australe]